MNKINFVKEFDGRHREGCDCKISVDFEAEINNYYEHATTSKLKKIIDLIEEKIDDEYDFDDGFDSLEELEDTVFRFDLNEKKEHSRGYYAVDLKVDLLDEEHEHEI